MAKAAMKKKKVVKKSARVSGTAKAADKSAKPLKKAAKKAAKSARISPQKTAQKIDPLNQATYRSITPMLAVGNMSGAIDFYTNALGFSVRAVMDGPQGPVHAELQLRDTTLM